MSDDRFAFRMSPEMRKAIRRKAAADAISESSVVKQIIARALAAERVQTLQDEREDEKAS